MYIYTLQYTVIKYLYIFFQGMMWYMNSCSLNAYFQMLPGYENLLFAHSSWYTYAASMRIYKHWDFRLSSAAIATSKMSFSSYPGN